jgi:uncharacterized protein
VKLDRTERRIIGVLIEKRWATPEQYPLTLNYLVGAVNQKSNRDPVMALSDFEVEGALLALREKGLVLVRERDGGRVTRYAEKFTEELLLPEKECAVIAELLLRGAQTAPELARRASRMVRIEGPEQAEATLRGLLEKHLVRLLARQSGRRHTRWDHQLYAEAEAPEPSQPPAEAAPVAVPPPTVAAPFAPTPIVPSAPVAEDEIAALRRELMELKLRVTKLEEAREDEGRLS